MPLIESGKRESRLTAGMEGEKTIIVSTEMVSTEIVSTDVRLLSRLPQAAKRNAVASTRYVPLTENAPLWTYETARRSVRPARTPQHRTEHRPLRSSLSYDAIQTCHETTPYPVPQR